MYFRLLSCWPCPCVRLSYAFSHPKIVQKTTPTILDSLRNLQSSACVILQFIAPRRNSSSFMVTSSLTIYSTMAASRPKRSVKQPLIVIWMHLMQCHRWLLARLFSSQAQQHRYYLWPRRNLQNPPRFMTNWRLEWLKQQNLQLELQLLSQKEKLCTQSLLSKQDKTEQPKVKVGLQVNYLVITMIGSEVFWGNNSPRWYFAAQSKGRSSSKLPCNHNDRLWGFPGI